MHQDFLHLGIPLSFRSNNQNDNKSERKSNNLANTISSHMSKSFKELENFI